MKKIIDTILSSAKLILIISCCVLIIISFLSIRSCNKIKSERDRVERNFDNVNFKIDSVEGKNGEYHAKVSSLLLTKNELEKFNSGLVDSIKDLKVKIKNLEGYVKVEYRYVYVYDTIRDTIFVQRLNDSTFATQLKNKWIDLYQEIVVECGGVDIRVDSLKLEIPDNLLIVTENKYKGWWFWKRVIGYDIHIKSDNPYMKLDKVQSVKISK